MKVRRLEYTREQKGYDKSDNYRGKRWKKNTPKALNHASRSFQGTGSSGAIIPPDSSLETEGVPMREYHQRARQENGITWSLERILGHLRKP